MKAAVLFGLAWRIIDDCGWSPRWFERAIFAFADKVLRTEPKAGLSGQQNWPHIQLRAHEKFALVCLSERYAPFHNGNSMSQSKSLIKVVAKKNNTAAQLFLMFEQLCLQMVADQRVKGEKGSSISRIKASVA